MDTDIIVAFVSGIFALVGILIPLWIKVRREKAEKEQAVQEMRFQRAALDLTIFLEDWSQFMADLERLMEETNIDRFLILRAWNGHLDPKYTTAVMQVRKGPHKPTNYIHTELDIDYVGRIREISQKNVIRFNVADIPDSLIKDIYDTEGVESSLWAHIETRQLKGTKSASITYCSFSSTSGDIDDSTATKCLLLANQLQGVSAILQSAGDQSDFQILNADGSFREQRPFQFIVK